MERASKACIFILETMIIPVRCFTCGNVLADKWEAYLQLTELLESHVKKSSEGSEGSEGSDTGAEVATKSACGLCLDVLGVDKVCCRLHFITSVDLVDNL